MITTVDGDDDNDSSTVVVVDVMEDKLMEDEEGVRVG